MVAHLQSPQPEAFVHEPPALGPARRPSLNAPPGEECQICFEASPVLTTLCSPACPAVVCHSCLQTHIRTTLNATLPGILPRVRCPVCLTRLTKSAWQSHVTPETAHDFESLCAKACEFIAPCCHVAGYTQLPPAPSEDSLPLEKLIDVCLHDRLPELRARLTRFEQYGLTGRELVHFLDELVAPIGFERLARQEFMDSVLQHVGDDERRAALVLAFHGVHRCAITRCCLARVCFCCKSTWDGHHEENPQGPCDAVDLTDSEMVQCRACRLMLVKVDGCDSVQCPCGFEMSWIDEVVLRGDLLCGLIPTTVDPLDVVQFELWDTWRRQVVQIVRYDVPVMLATRRLNELSRLMAPFRGALRRMVQTWLWRKRFRAALPNVAREIYRVRLRMLTQRLRRQGFCMGGLMRTRVRVRIQRCQCLRQIKLHVPPFEQSEITENELLASTFGLFGDLLDEM